MRNRGLVMAEWRRRARVMTQTDIARASGATVQAVCDVVKGRRGPNRKLLKWLGFEIGYVPLLPRKPRTNSEEADSVGAQPQPAADLPRVTQPLPGAEV